MTHPNPRVQALLEHLAGTLQAFGLRPTFRVEMLRHSPNFEVVTTANGRGAAVVVSLAQMEQMPAAHLNRFTEATARAMTAAWTENYTLRACPEDVHLDVTVERWVP